MPMNLLAEFWASVPNSICHAKHEILCIIRNIQSNAEPGTANAEIKGRAAFPFQRTADCSTEAT